MYYIGFDIGGTKIEAMLLYFGKSKSKKDSISQFEFQNQKSEIALGTILYKKRVATERHAGYEQIIDKMAKLAKDICLEKKINLHDVSGVGLSVPGPVDPVTQKISMSNSMVMTGHNLHKDLKSKLKMDCPFSSENDANCFALAEVLCGAGLDYFKKTKIPVSKQVAVGLILGSGFGGGIVVNGKIMTGKKGGAGEVGHMTLYPGGHPCYCGRRGCAEQYLCGPALEAALNNRIYSQIEKRPTALEIFELYKSHDPIALAVVKQYKKDLAFFLGSVTCLLDPHYFVFGGGLSLQPLIYEGLEKKIAENTYLEQNPVTLFKHQVGDSAGAIGAVLTMV
jgi:fructokinase